LHPSHAHLDKLSTHFCRNRSKPLRLPALEDLCILLITNKASNILQDIDTLHLFARVMSDICRAADEREIQKQSFELLGAFDEIVSMCYREQVNLIQVRSVFEMESHEEKIQDIIARVSAHQSGNPTHSFNDRTKKQRQKKDSSAVRANLSSSTGSSKSALQYLAVGAAHILVEIFSCSSALRRSRGAGGARCITRTCVQRPHTPRSRKLGNNKIRQTELLDALSSELVSEELSAPSTPPISEPSPAPTNTRSSLHSITTER
jgi:hypothetical protein